MRTEPARSPDPTATPPADPAVPAVRRARAITDRIDRIRAELAGGHYGVDLDRLAENIFEDDLDRSSSRRP